MGIAQMITKDINILHVSGWVYWQAVEERVWGLIYAHFGSSETDTSRGDAYKITTKYYVFAQFTRFILPGDQIIASNDVNTVVARTPTTNSYKFVTVNYNNYQMISFNLAGIGKVLPASVIVTYTRTDGSALMQTYKVPVVRSTVNILASTNTVYSVFV